MSEQNDRNQELHELSAKWLAKSQEAEQRGRQLSVANVQQALYQRGLAEGLRLAVADLQQLLGNNDLATEQTSEASYAYVTREDALELLGQVGIHITELHQHEDHTFSAILPPLQVFSFEERLGKLRENADIIILAKGKLPNTNKAYVDFAFNTPYQS